MTLRLILLLLLAASAACGPGPAGSRAAAGIAVQPPTALDVKLIPLAGPLAEPAAEISGMAWNGDRLVLLPQFPGRYAGADGADGLVWTLQRDQITAFLDGRSNAPLEPSPLPLHAPGLEALPGYGGLEAIAFAGDRVWVTVELQWGDSATHALLVPGTLRPGAAGIHLQPDRGVEIRSASGVFNLGEEALLVAGGEVLTLHEASGAALVSTPVAHRFDLELRPRASLPVPPLEYRVTDATAPDAEGAFWVTNYLYPGDHALHASHDPLAPGAAPRERVERLVELRLTPEGVRLARARALDLALPDTGQPRNWEAVARLPGRGLLIATDRFPTTLFGFVEVK